MVGLATGDFPKSPESCQSFSILTGKSETLKIYGLFSLILYWFGSFNFRKEAWIINIFKTLKHHIFGTS